MKPKVINYITRRPKIKSYCKPLQKILNKFSIFNKYLKSIKNNQTSQNFFHQQFYNFPTKQT